MIHKILNKFILTITGLLIALEAHAIVRENPATKLFFSFGNDNRNDPQTLIKIATNFVLAIAGLIALLYLIWGGFEYLMAGANEDLAKTAKKRVRNSLIGLIIILLSYTIVSVVIRELSR